MLWLRRYRGDLIVLLVLVGGFVLNLTAPVWLAPPLFSYTVWLYLLLFFAWIPAYWLLARRRPGRRLRPILVALVGVFLTSFLCMVTVPRSAFGVTIFLDTVDCRSLPAEVGRVRYACTRRAFDGPQYDRTMILEGLAGIPLLVQREIQPGSGPVMAP